jgi:ferredoxin
MRTLAHREAISETDFVEVLDYETATSVIEQANRFAIGYCSCRHEKVHVGEKTCSVPLETCSSFGIVADYLVRHAMAREVSKAEMLENVSRSKELKLVLTADNIRKGTTFMCHCCKCCCNVLLGINKHGYPNVLVTSSYIAEIDDAKCTGCELCVKNCPVNAIEMVAVAVTEGERRKKAVVDRSICLGCGVCGLACRKGAAMLAKRAKRVLHPETTFERVILQTLERGTLQNQLLDVPGRVSGKVMRGIIGGFLRLPPVKQAVMSELLRSTFLWSMKAGARLQGKEALTRL